MRKYFLSLFFLSTLLTTLAQKNFKNAVLTTNSGETINGFVNDKEKFRNPKFIRFSETVSKEGELYSAASIKSIKIEGGSYYISKIVTIDETPDNLEMDNNFDSSRVVIRKDTVFLIAELLSSKINFYTYDNANKLHLYVQKEGGEIQELIYKKYYLKTDGVLYDADVKIYVSQLQNLFNDCPKAVSSVANTKFSLKGIRSLIENYIKNCKNSFPTYKKDKVKEKLQVAVLAGIAQPGIETTAYNNSVNSTGTDLLMKNEYVTKMSVIAGLRLNYIIPGRQKKMSLVTDVYYSKVNSKAHDPLTYPASPYTAKDVVIDLSTVRLNLLFRYTFSGKALLSPYIQAGPSVGYIVSSNNNVTYSRPTYPISRDPFPNNGMRKFLGGFAAGAGVAIGKFGVEYKFEQQNTITGYRDFACTIKPTHIVQLSYSFKN